MSRIKTTVFLGLIVALFGACGEHGQQPKEKLNILMIAVDDLRPELGCYGNTIIQTPNIDKIASNGVVFSSAYCNIPVCGASRASLMTGKRPTRNRFIDYLSKADFEVPEATPIHKHLKENGYHTVSIGKIFHHVSDHGNVWDENWRPVGNVTWRDYQIEENIKKDLDGGEGPPYECADVHDTVYFDGKVALRAINSLKELKDVDKPFFMAVGFIKPHLPFNAPKKYWDLYKEDDFKAPLKKFWPENAPKYSFHNSGELRAYGMVPKEGFLSDSLAMKLQHGYYACVSYTDALIGQVLEALKELGMEKNTAIVLWGDHGWNLGDHGMWCKHANYRSSLQVPLIVNHPERKNGAKINSIVEFVDVYPTICDLANISIPNTVEGKSLSPLMQGNEKDWKNMAICKWYDGVTIKTDKYAYTEWRNEKDELYAKMLYDHVNDVNETDNVSSKPELQEIQEELSNKLKANRGKDFFKPGEPYTE